jgi:hypothetical protein
MTPGKFRVLSVVSILALAVLACSFGPGNPQPKIPDLKIPTLEAPTLEVPAVDLPTLQGQDDLNALATEVAGQQETLAAQPVDNSTATPESMDAPPAILIQSPGMGSLITSPVTIKGEANPTFEQNLVVEISAMDGTVLVQEPTIIQVEAGQRGPFSIDLNFSVDSQQNGRITVKDVSAMDGGLISVSSVEVTLLPGGTAKIEPGTETVAPIHITTPQFMQSFSGGVLHVEGISVPVFENTLAVIICGEGAEGQSNQFCGTETNVVGSGNAIIDSPNFDKPGPFSADIQYKVNGPMRGRVMVFYTSMRDGGIIFLTSRPVELNP